MKNKAAELFYQLIVWLALTIVAAAFVFMMIWLAAAGKDVLSLDSVLNFLFSPVWSPVEGKFGILSMLLSSLLTAVFAAVISSGVSFFASGFIFIYFTGKTAKNVLRTASVLSGLPSVLFGLIGMTVLVPWIGENFDFAAKSGGAGMPAAVGVLSLMLMPSMTLTLYEAMSSADRRVALASDALGATRTETFFGCTLPMVKPAGKAASANSLRRAVGEATAVILVSGNASGDSLFFSPMRTLAGTVVLEMGYAAGAHRSALFAIGLVLLLITLFLPSGRDKE